ncbi:MAG: M1 family peptidase [Actinobacteria bacterium]|uniref:Unannotated protein n=1 Tax=freshwater metagenome TaxID=449393 RepID=A0A6J6QT84_9ZZZZ|nr:M1 family peptidase [Actinomycetota bacterium]
MTLRRATLALTASAVLAAGLTAGPSALSQTADAPATTARRGPDTLFPLQGNAGYDVRSYDVSMDYAPLTNLADAAVTIRATARKRLTSFHLDFAGPTISTVVVGGRPAAYRRDGDELIVTPATAVPQGRFTTVVTYSGEPPEYTDADGSTEGWVRTTDGAVALGEPVGAMTWLPSNNTPADKATYTYRISVPNSYEVAANGDLVSRDTVGSSTTWTWRSSDPMSTYLAMIAIGQFTMTTAETTSIDGRTIPIWSFEDVPTGAAASAKALLPEVLAFEEKHFGPYPFTSTGLVVDNAMVGYALETQSRPFYPPGGADDLTVVHEMAHQWYGDSVTLRDWHDIWLAEGFATYAEWMWDGAHGGDTPRQHFDDLYATPESGALWRPAPRKFTDSADLFGSPVYNRGAMTLQALRMRIGNADFATFLKAWARAHRHGSASTADLVRLAEKVSGQELSPLFRTWLDVAGKPKGY